MKKLIYIIIAIIGISLIFSCEKDSKDPILDMELTEKPIITTPIDGSIFELNKEDEEDVFSVFQWTATKYSLSNLESTNYTLQIDIADSSFKNLLTIANTKDLSYEMTIGGMNNKLLIMGVIPGQPTEVSLRIYSYINTSSDYSAVYSEENTITVTAYADIVYIKPIYLLGSGTPAGWVNTEALEMAYLGDGKFARVEYLDPDVPDSFFKFISVLGAWAPQWGTDAAGTPEVGPLIYRPDEATPDPDAMPTPEVAGNYYIEADTANLEYKTFLTSGELYLVGDATSAGWDYNAGLPFAENPDTAHLFSITTNLLASGGMKFIDVLGEEIPQWGTTTGGTSAGGKLVYRPEGSVPDPANIPAPSDGGSYKIVVDLRKLTYTISPE